MKPLNRKEIYLARMAGEDVTMPKPLTREEAWMKGLAEAINGQNDVKTPEPLTREEHYLETITEKLIEATSDLIEKNVTANGEYRAATDNADGYSKVTVNVPLNNANIADGTGAFTLASAIESVTIPSGYTSLGDDALNGCTSLESITIEATTPPTVGTDALANVPADCAIYVPEESVDAYKAASGWSDRAAYIQAIEE